MALGFGFYAARFRPSLNSRGNVNINCNDVPIFPTSAGPRDCRNESGTTILAAAVGPRNSADGAVIGVTKLPNSRIQWVVGPMRSRQNTRVVVKCPTPSTLQTKQIFSGAPRGTIVFDSYELFRRYGPNFASQHDNSSTVGNATLPTRVHWSATPGPWSHDLINGYCL